MYTKWLSTLIKTELFKNLTRHELSFILNCLQPRIKTYEQKEIINSNDTAAPEVGIILKGEVDVIKENFSGGRVIISRLKTTEIFGGVQAFANNSFHAIIETTKETTVLFMPTSKIVGMCPNLCQGHEKLIGNMLEIVSNKAMSLNQKVEILSLKSIRERISYYLIEQQMKEQSCTFTIPLKRYELADFLNTTRPSLSRELIKMKEEGLIDFYKNSFKIVDIGSLKKCLQ